MISLIGVQVSVPCSSLSMVVTVRCGHCTSLLSVNMKKASFVPLHLLAASFAHDDDEVIILSIYIYYMLFSVNIIIISILTFRICFSLIKQPKEGAISEEVAVTRKTSDDKRSSPPLMTSSENEEEDIVRVNPTVNKRTWRFAFS